jgi:replicative DNA helicase
VDNPGEIPGLSTGIRTLDEELGGLRAEQLCVISGMTGGGKTALAFGIATNLAVGHSVPVGYISLEMSAEELVERAVARLAGLDMHRVMLRGANQSEAYRITQAIEVIKTSKLHIRDAYDVNVSQLRAVARQLKHQHRIELLVVDYLQLIRQTDPDRREAEISGAAMSFKHCAKELSIPVIVLSQLSDEGKLSYARAIGHHADKIVRIDHSGKTASLIIDKNRSGAREREIPVHFNKQLMVFTGRLPEDGKAT